MSPISILVVDDHALLREGVRAMLSTQADMRIVGEAENGLDAVAAYDRLLPDIVLMDLQMAPGWMLSRRSGPIMQMRESSF